MSTQLNAPSIIWKLINHRHFPKQFVQSALDITTLFSAFFAAHLLRFDFSLEFLALPYFWAQLAFVIGVQVSALYLTKAHLIMWRYVGITELKSFIFPFFLSSLLLIALRFTISEPLYFLRVPASIILIDSFFAICGVLSTRLLLRSFYEDHLRKSQSAPKESKRKNIILIGAGSAGHLVARHLRSSVNAKKYRLIGFIDDDPAKKGVIIVGKKVFGSTRILNTIVQKFNAHQIIICVARHPDQIVKKVVRLCENTPIKIRIVPPYYKIINEEFSVNSIRDVKVSDLLRRDPIELDTKSLNSYLSAKVIMITGAGGSIGSELCRQAIRFSPKKLLLLERSEPALFAIEQELKLLNKNTPITALVADIIDTERMGSLFAFHRPQVVLHAAAHKHVPLMEENTYEAIRNNTIGTKITGEIAKDFKAESFVLISTDKAVRPTSIMGASKRLAEQVVRELSESGSTKFAAVRFGNVLGSSGSVIPTFKAQIKRGGPITVTHPDMTRYFMTIPEACQLVLQAAAMADGGELFILDMGKPVRILDLANDMIRLSGLTPGSDIKIEFTGTRPGEKLYEELHTSENDQNKTKHPKIFNSTLELTTRNLIAELPILLQMAKSSDPGALKAEISKFICDAQLIKKGLLPPQENIEKPQVVTLHELPT